jgi:sugar/nucleoside kinase (ribokinase family)
MLAPLPVQVAVIGNIGIDTNVFFQGNSIDFSVEANFTQNLDTIGQAGGYASRGYNHLGYRTAFIGYVGQDYSGDHIRSILSNEGINTEGLFIDPEGTSRSINFMYPDGKRKNFYDGKGHMNLHPPLETCQKILQGAKLAHFNIPNWARELLPLAHQEGVKIACDIQDLVEVNDPYRSDFIQAADFLFFSAANHADPAPLIRIFLEQNPKLVIVSGMGSQGCMLGTRTILTHFPAVKLDLPIIDTNGAGDALALGFLTSYVFENRSLEQSILRGQISARYKCAQKSTSGNMITHALLDHYEKTL